MAELRIIDPFHRNLRGQIIEELENCETAVANGQASSFDDYRRQCGYILGLRRVLTLCEETEKSMYSGGGDEQREDP